MPVLVTHARPDSAEPGDPARLTSMSNVWVVTPLGAVTMTVMLVLVPAVRLMADDAVELANDCALPVPTVYVMVLLPCVGVPVMVMEPTAFATDTE